MKTPTSIRVRAVRFLSERYWQREQPSYFAELLLFAIIVIISAWPMISLAQAMESLR
jgi:hypothetical protein